MTDEKKNVYVAVIHHHPDDLVGESKSFISLHLFFGSLVKVTYITASLSGDFFLFAGQSKYFFLPV